MAKQKRELPDGEFSIAFNKCIKEGIRIYPVPTSNGSNKVKARVKLIVDYGTKTIDSKDVYSQEEDMTTKVIELYKFIANKL